LQIDEVLVLSHRQEPLLVVRLVGGLGNQLFQFAAAKGLQVNPESPVVVDSGLDHIWGRPLERVLVSGSFREATTPELLLLGCLPKLVRSDRMSSHMPRSMARATCMASRVSDKVARAWAGTHVGSRLATIRTFQEASTLGFDKQALAVRGPTRLSGYFQSEEYFVHRSAAVCASFKPAPPDFANLQRAIEAFAGPRPVVAVTLRTGADYRRFGCVLNAEYYHRAAERILSELGDVAFVVFGDILADCQTLCRVLEKFGPAMSLADASSESQLHLIARQPHVVLANSSFAWWGAWLGDQRAGAESRVVVRPKPWLPSPPGDVCPNRWRAIITGFNESDEFRLA
jgi:hypothetical protein